MVEAGEVKGGARVGRRDWRVAFGLLATLAWLTLGAAYVHQGVGWEQFVASPVSELGEFLDGAFAPLAFLWLVLGLFMQQSELAANNRAIARQYDVMRHAAEQAEIQARAISANELHARQDTFIDIAKLVGQQLEVISGMIFMSTLGPAGDGAVDADEMDALWARMSSGESALFTRRLIGLRFNLEDDEAREVFWGTPIRRRHSESFIRSFERLRNAARGCDPEGMIVDALDGSAHGRLYRTVVELRDLVEDGATV